MFSLFRRVAKRDWGLGYKSFRIIYKGLFLVTTTFATSVLDEVAICTKTVQVMADELPIDLEARRRSINYALRRGIAVEVGNRNFQIKENDTWRMN